MIGLLRRRREDRPATIGLLRRLVPARGHAAGGEPAFSDRVVHRASAALARPSFDRRGFLWRVTLAGTALAVNPFDFALKPGTAYASICGRAASCSGGWSAFCCTIHGGANVCPPGSFAAGWWRVDDSAFCRGAARFIIDCNRRPRASCRCRCASGTCDQRRVCCNRFRYGQCNQHIGAVTEVVCRVVTCTPPWRWDPSCTRTVRVDNRTATHTAPCLPGRWPTHIAMKYQDMGLVGSVLGAPAGRERDAAGGGRTRHFEAGVILYKRGIGAKAVHGAIASAYARHDRERGPLGYPTTDRQRLADGRGRRNRFERGIILWTRATGAHAVYGVFRTAYRREGLQGGPLGYPIEDRRPNGDDRGRRQRFERGVILRTQATGTHAVYGGFHDLFRDTGGTVGALGYPISRQRNVGDGRGRVQRFERGAIYHTRQTRTRVVHGPFHDAYERRRGPRGLLGYPTSGRRKIGDGRGQLQRFESGRIYSTAETGARSVHGAIFKRYEANGETQGPLGYPTRDRSRVGDGRGFVQRFENGAIYLSGETGARHVVGTWNRRYVEHGGPRGPLGYPMTGRRRVGDRRGRVQRFERGAIYRTATTGIRAVYGPIHRRYVDRGGPTGPLGYPLTSVETDSDGVRRVTFEGGTITHDPATGRTVVRLA